MDLTAIASAIARQFSDELTTPPSGYAEPGTATYRLPTAITTTPTCIVFPPEGDLTFYAQTRSGILSFPVRFYLGDEADQPRAIDAMYAWGGVLLDRLETNYDLDLNPPVTRAFVDGIRFGKLEFAGQEYTGIELSLRVHVVEAYEPTSVGGFSNGFDGGFLT